MAELINKIASTLLEIPYISPIIHVSKKFYNDPKETYNSWSVRQRYTFVCASSFISFYIIYKIKSSYASYQLRKQGYRMGDLTTQFWELAQEINASPTVSGFQIANDAFTFDDLKDFAKTWMKMFINFRSQIYKINGRWYFKEEFDPETEDMNEYCKYIPMECGEITKSDNNEEIEEKIFQTVLTYLNKNHAFNVIWNEYKRAHFDMYYFHFKKQHKMVFFVRFNHSLGDGILIASLAGLVQNKLYNPDFKHKDIDFSNPSSDTQTDFKSLLSSVFAIKMPKYSISSMIYHYLHWPIAWFKLFVYVSRIELDRESKFRGKFQNYNRLAVARPIKLEQFRSIAKKHNATVNDLFQAISFRALKRYALKYDCDAFNDEKFHGIYTAMGIVNRRGLSPKTFTKELRQYALEGTNSNKLDFTPYYVNVKKADIKEAQKSFSMIKYGYSPKAFKQLSDGISIIPGGTKFLFTELSKAVTIVTSNFQGPSELIPLPGKKKQNEESKEDERDVEYVSWIFGMAVPAMLPLNFTLMTYNGHIRVGVLTESGSVEDPNLLMDCFVEEWNDYNI